MKLKLLLPLLFLSQFILAQDEPILPRHFTEEEKTLLHTQSLVPPVASFGITEPPPQPVRHMAEWEELQALVITWRSFPEILTEIVRHAKEEVKVLIVCRTETEEASIKNILTTSNITLDSVEFVIADNNSIWVRDYGPQCVYANDVDSLYFIDWIYNRPARPKDNLIPDAIGAHLGVPVFSTTEAPEDLVNTGGNFMSDGMGTAFASKLILDENKAGNPYNVGPHNESVIDGIVQSYMGIDNYVKMETLPYDQIHHIDMHMRLFDEETILMGQYPQGIADGPQIEANLQYVLSNFNSPFGTPYKVVRLVQPPQGNAYPSGGGDYRTYTNSVFINKTILIPTYEQKYDTTALRVYRENFPGYKVVGINCNQIIPLSGALHCITKEIGVTDPLQIVHQRHPNVDNNETVGDYEIKALLRHRSGIASAQLFYRTDTLTPYLSVSMFPENDTSDFMVGHIPHQPNGSQIYYYIAGEANSGKHSQRPLAAPAGYYRFKVDGVSTTAEPTGVALKAIYPNPANAITVLPVQANAAMQAKVEVVDVLGKTVEVVFDGQLPTGESNFFIQAAGYLPGTYFVNLKTESGLETQKLVVK